MEKTLSEEENMTKTESTILKKYNREDILKVCLEYFNGDELAANVWINKYALKENGKYKEKSPEDTINRLAKEIHRKEKEYPNPLTLEEIHDNLKDFSNFIFGGSILSGTSSMACLPA